MVFVIFAGLPKGSAGKDARILGRFRSLLRRIEEPDRSLLLHMAQKMARPTRNRV
jgi:hypothetical protein